MFPTIHGILAASETVATYQVITAGAATHTINSLGLSAATLVDWGDGSTSTLSGTALRTHSYAGAGTWTVTIYLPENVTRFDMRDSKAVITTATLPINNVVTFIITALNAASVIDTSHMTSWSSITSWQCYSLPSGGTYSIDTSHMVNWSSITTWYCLLLPSGGTYSIDTSHMVNWSSITTWLCYSLPSGGTYNIDTSNMTSWSLIATWLCYSLPSGSITNVAQNGFANFTKCVNFRFDSNSLSQSDVDTALWSLYQATTAPRTVSGGTINIGGSNAAPSGTFQAASACPVTVATDGKEVAYELLNDSCGAGFNKWSTVTITT